MLSADHEEINTISLAVELGKFPYEIDALPCSEYDRLITYFKWKKRQEPKQPNKQEAFNSADFKERVAAANKNKGGRK